MISYKWGASVDKQHLPQPCSFTCWWFSIFVAGNCSSVMIFIFKVLKQYVKWLWVLKLTHNKHKFCQLEAFRSARSPLVAKWSETVSHFLPCVSSPPYCMTELSVAMVTVVANSNSTGEIVLHIALRYCWSRVGMIKGMKPLSVFFPRELYFSVMSVFLMSSRSETDWKRFHHLLTGDLHKCRLVPATGEGPSV